MPWKRFYCRECEWELHERTEDPDHSELSRHAIAHTITIDHDIDSEYRYYNGT